MRKIGVTTKLATYMASVISGAMVFGSFAYLFTPAEVKPNPLPVVNFANTNLDTGSITGTSPFALPESSGYASTARSSFNAGRSRHAGRCFNRYRRVAA